MPNLSDIFHDLAERDQRSFANAPRDANIISRARRARGRTRALQATGGTLALGGLAFGGAQLLPSGTATAEAASAGADVPLTLESSLGQTAAPATDGAGDTTLVNFDEFQWSSSDNSALQRIEAAFQCNGPAPTPTAGAATITLDDVEVRAGEGVLKFEESPAPGTWFDDMAGTASVVSTNGEALYSDLTASAILFVKDGEIVEIFGANYVNPGEAAREIHAPAGYDGDLVSPETETEAGIAAVLTDEATSLVTGYSAWDCVPGSGSVDFGEDSITYHAPSDYLESGDYQAYLVAEVNVNEQSAALHQLNALGVDLWNSWTLDQQLDDLGLNHITESDPEEDYDYLFIDVPVPSDTIPAQSTSEIIVSEAVTVTIP